MSIVVPESFDAVQGAGAYLMARVEGTDGTNLQQSDIDNIVYSTFDLSDPSTAVVDGTALTVSSVIFDSLQTSDTRWDEDSTGYNFGWSSPASLYPTGKRRVRVQVKITETGGGVAYVRWTANVKDVLGV